MCRKITDEEFSFLVLKLGQPICETVTIKGETVRLPIRITKVSYRKVYEGDFTSKVENVALDIYVSPFKNAIEEFMTISDSHPLQFFSHDGEFYLSSDKSIFWVYFCDNSAKHTTSKDLRDTVDAFITDRKRFNEKNR